MEAGTSSFVAVFRTFLAFVNPMFFTRKCNLLIVKCVAVCLMFVRLSASAQESGWVVPKWADTLVMPSVNLQTGFAEQKRLFSNQCAVCHGESGKGDGESGFGLSVPPGDLTDVRTRGQADGVLFYKVTYGRHPMPAFATLLSDQQRWHLVAYIRQLQQQAGERKKSRHNK